MEDDRRPTESEIADDPPPPIPEAIFDRSLRPNTKNYKIGSRWLVEQVLWELRHFDPLTGKFFHLEPTDSPSLGETEK